MTAGWRIFVHRQLIKQVLLTLGFVLTVQAMAWSQYEGAAALFMCNPSEVVSADDFESETVADRWGFRAYYAVENGVLKRTAYQRGETARSFLKDVVYRDVVIRFDFRFDGATELRLMTGGSGGYNTVTQIFPSYFQVNTAKRKSEFNPSFQGECAFEFKQGVWYTMTIEFNGDEVVAHVNKECFVIGSHPIIDSERTYLAFQVTGGAASFDNFSMSKSKPKSSWESERGKLLAVQSKRSPAINRNAKEEYDLIYLNLKDRLKRTDSKYRQLVARHTELSEKLKQDFPSANQTQKELGKRIASTRIDLKKTEPLLKEMELALNRSRRAIKDYVHSKYPNLDDLPKQKYYWEYERRLGEMVEDVSLIELTERSNELEARLHAAFPAAYQDVDALVKKRNLAQAELRSNDEYRTRKKEIADANRAVEVYLFEQEPRLAELSGPRQAIIKANR